MINSEPSLRQSLEQLPVRFEVGLLRYPHAVPDIDAAESPL